MLIVCFCAEVASKISFFTHTGSHVGAGKILGNPNCEASTPKFHPERAFLHPDRKPRWGGGRGMEVTRGLAVVELVGRVFETGDWASSILQVRGRAGEKEAKEGGGMVRDALVIELSQSFSFSYFRFCRLGT